MATNAPLQFANAVIKVDTVVVAKVTSIKVNRSLQEVDVTGAEDVSGALVDEQFLPVSVGTTVDLEGIFVSGLGETVAQRREPGQADMVTAMEAGTEAVLQVLDANGYGDDFTGYFTGYSDLGAVKDVWKWTGTFRVNSKSAVTP